MHGWLFMRFEGGVIVFIFKLQCPKVIFIFELERKRGSLK